MKAIYNLFKAILSLFIIGVCVMPSYAFAKLEDKANFVDEEEWELEVSWNAGINSLRNAGWEITGFDLVSDGTNVYLRSSNEISSNSTRFIETPWIYLNPGEFEVEMVSSITNASKKKSFNTTITLIDVLGKTTTVDLEHYEDASPTDKDVEFDIDSRGYYKIQITHQAVTKKGGSDTYWQIYELEFEGYGVKPNWSKDAWKIRTENTISMSAMDENGNSVKNNVFFQGDSLMVEYQILIKTSSDILAFDTVSLDVSYPEVVDITKIELFINDELATYTEDLITWTKSDLACGCPRDFTYDGSEGEYRNRLKVIRGRNNDVLTVKVYGLAGRLGTFDVSIQYMGGKGREIEPAPVTNNTIISNSSSIITFATQDQFELEGDAEPTTTSGTIIPNSTQPVELIYFRAQTENTNPVLEWATALEINNDYFSVERSQNGRDFIAVGRVQGKGDYSGTSEYSFEDRSARTGTWYYRLVQHDFNGDSKTYDAVRAVVEKRTEAKIQVLKNPSNSHQIVFNLEGIDNPADYNITVVDMNGRMVSTQSLRNYYQSSGTITLDGLNLSKGVYMLNVYNNRSRLVSKVLVD